MSKANLTQDLVEVLSGKDGIIIRKHIAGIEGGRVLDTTVNDYSLDVIPCGTPIASKTANDETTYIPIPPTDKTSGSSTTYTFDLPTGYTYVGIAAATVRTNQGCPIMVSGVVNETAMLNILKEIFPSSMETPTTLSLSVLKTACPHLIFLNDEVA